jgi:hypothetical protein
MHHIDFIALNEEIECLGEELNRLTIEVEGQVARAYREELYLQKRQLMSIELRK